LLFLATACAFAGGGAFAQEAETPADGRPDTTGPIDDEALRDVTDDAGEGGFHAHRPLHLLDPHEYTLRWQDGLRFERNDGLFRLKVGARVEIDIAGIFGDEDIEAAFGDSGFEWELRRAWITAGGTIGRRWLYKLQVDLSGNSANEDGRYGYVREIYLGAAGLGWFGTVKLGSLRAPFTLNGLTSSHTLSFQERALSQAFSPVYNPGIVSESNALDRRIAWAYGLFYSAGSDADSGASLDLTGRISGLPIYEEDGERLLHVGASYSHQFRSGYDLQYQRRPETRLTDRYVDTGEAESGDIDLFGVELLGIRGPLSARAEVVLSHVGRPGAPNEIFWSAYAEVGYILTGETRPYRPGRGLLGRLEPANPVRWRGGGWGLLEVAARYSYLDLDDRSTNGGKLGDLGVALNWYPRAHARVMLNYIFATRFGVGRSNILQARFAVDF
jgi:phosphate-selective porin OprO/OprP